MSKNKITVSCTSISPDERHVQFLLCVFVCLSNIFNYMLSGTIYEPRVSSSHQEDSKVKYPREKQILVTFFLNFSRCLYVVFYRALFQTFLLFHGQVQKLSCRQSHEHQDLICFTLRSSGWGLFFFRYVYKFVNIVSRYTIAVDIFNCYFN